MNEICNILRIYKLSQLKAVTESEVIPKSGEKPLTVYPDHLDLELSPDQQDGGLLYKIEQTIPVSKLPEDEAVLFPYTDSLDYERVRIRPGKGHYRDTRMPGIGIYHSAPSKRPAFGYLFDAKIPFLKAFLPYYSPLEPLLITRYSW